MLDYIDVVRDQRGGAYRGVVFANIVSVDPMLRFVFIKPKENDLPRMHIFLDPLTQYTISKIGTRKRSSSRLLVEGDRIVARVFTRNGVIVADEIFYIEGRFEPPSKYERKTYQKSSKGSSLSSAPKEVSSGGR